MNTLDATLPANLDAERTILGAILLDERAIIEAATKIDADDFVLDSHRRIFLRMSDLSESKRAIDIVTLAEELSKHKEIEQVGGVAYLASLTEGLPRRPVIDEYLRIVKDKSMLRRIMSISNGAVARAQDQTETALEVGGAVAAELDRLLTRGTRSNLLRVGDYLVTNGLTPQAMVEKARQTKGVLTGITDFDGMTGGFQKSELSIVAARPSIGKSSFAFNVAERSAVDRGLTVAIFSQEMSRDKVLAQMICSRAHVSLQKFRKGLLNQTEMSYFAREHDAFVDVPLYIDDSSAVTLAYIRNCCRAMKHRGPLDLVEIDHLGLMSTEGAPKKYNRAQEVGWLTAGLKVLAQELEVPIVLLCQLSRGVHGRQDKRPNLSDLRESGSIEQDADLVAFLHREEYYEQNEDNKGKGEVIVSKQRQGPTGTAPCAYDAPITRWSDKSVYIEAGLPW